MGRKKRWIPRSYDCGYEVVELSSWRSYFDYMSQVLINYGQYIYRGQADSKWALQTCLDRRLREIGKLNDKSVRNLHLENFKHAVRGRRGPHPHVIKDNNLWWALGQHHGLATPLLDWTESPFVALYFAFESAVSPEIKFRSVYALAAKSVSIMTSDIEIELEKETKSADSEDRTPLVEIVRPLSDENARLTSQRGLFTRLPDGIVLESWIRDSFNSKHHDRVFLQEFLIPNAGRENCLKSLNRMNINRLSLFPDIEGAASYCDTKLLIDNY